MHMETSFVFCWLWSGFRCLLNLLELDDRVLLLAPPTSVVAPSISSPGGVGEGEMSERASRLLRKGVWTSDPSRMDDADAIL